MNMMDTIIAKAKAKPQRIAFPESDSAHMLKCVAKCVEDGICVPVLVNTPEAVKAAAGEAGVDISGVEFIDSSNEAEVEANVAKYAEYKSSTGAPCLPAKSLKRRARNPLYYALMLQDIGAVDGTFAGYTNTTGDVILAGQFVIGMQEGVEVVSSLGVFDIPGWEGSEGQLLVGADMAINVYPSSAELASIAISTCDTMRELLDWEPRAAMLSFSSDGSMDNEHTQRVVEAVRIANERRPDLAIDGEFQFDAAVRPAVAAKKVKRESRVAGKANIIIFPDLNSGNIGVKLVQTFSHADAYGPIIQGFAKPISDCSRSAPVTEICGNVAILCVRCQKAALHAE